MRPLQHAIFRSVLQVGEHHVQYRGGIGAVIATYEQYFPSFHAIGSHCHASGIGKIIYFIKNYFVFLWRLLTDREIKIVQIHGSYGASVYRKAMIAFTAKAIFGKKTIYHVHSSEYIQKYKGGSKLYKNLCEYLLFSSDYVACLTPNWKQQFMKEFGLQNVVVMLNMISPADFDHHYKPERNPERPLHLLFLGLIDEKKGVFDMVNMATEHKNDLADKVIIHMGGIGKVEELRSAITKNKISKIVHYSGWIGPVEKMALLKNVDAFILPSYNEGLPISILEAMSYGLPVIASRVGGIPEIMEDKENGFLIEKGDKIAMWEAIKEYSNNNLLLARHSKKSLEMVKQFYPEAVLPQIESIYRSLLDFSALPATSSSTAPSAPPAKAKQLYR